MDYGGGGGLHCTLFGDGICIFRVVIGVTRRLDDFGKKMEAALACRHFAR